MQPVDQWMESRIGATRSAPAMTIARAFDARGIGIPYPQVTFRVASNRETGSLPVQVQ